MTEMSEPRRTALVIGGSGTVGAAVVRKLAGAGMDIAVHYCRSRARAESVLATLRAGENQGIIVQANLHDRAEISSLFKQIHETLGRVDVLVNSAGAARNASFAAIAPGDWDTALAVNLTGPVECMRWATRDMAASGWGRVVNLGSIAELVAWRGQAGYVAAKAGLTAVSRVAARELARHGVTVNVVAPGLVASSAAEEALSEQQRAEILARVPGGHPVTADAVAAAVSFLCSEEAGTITGQVLPVDGGMSV